MLALSCMGISLTFLSSATVLLHAQPDLKKTCCPQYTIRMSANEFQPSQSQKKLLKKWESCCSRGEDTEADTRFSGALRVCSNDGHHPQDR